MATGVLLYPQFSEYELSIALSVLKQGNQPIVTISITNELVRGESDLVCLADATIADVDIEQLDSLLLPGCMDVGVVKDEEALFEFIRKVAAKDVPIAAICSAPFLLAKAGVLAGRNYTVSLTREQRDFIGLFDEDRYSDERIVVDGKLLTAKGKAYVEFGIRFGELLGLEFSPLWYRD